MKNNNLEIKITTKQVNGKTEQVITSLEFAKGTKNSHKVVMNLIRNNLTELEHFGRVHFEKSPFETKGGSQIITVAFLNEQQCTYLFTCLRNNDIVRKFKIKLVDAFYKLRNLALEKDLNYFLENPKETRGLLLGYVEKVLKLEPKAKAYDLIATAEKSDLCISTIAKELQLYPNELFKWLNKNRWIFKRFPTQNWLAYQDKINLGYLKLKVQEIWNNGTLKLRPQTYITPKGMAKLAEVFSKQENQIK